MRKRTIWKYEKPKLRVKGTQPDRIAVPCLVLLQVIPSAVIIR